MTIVEKIHKEFDEAVDSLVKISEERKRIANSTEIPQEEKDHENGIWLEKMGFSNSELARRAKEQSQLISLAQSEKEQNITVSKRIDDVVSKYQSKFPFHKFILYSQVIKICEKYNLFIAPADFFKGEIPQKNLEELKNFDWVKYSEEKILLSKSEAICEQAKTKKRDDRWLNSDRISPYICAPKNEFDVKEKITVGREMYEKTRRDKIDFGTIRLPKRVSKDPIILVPVETQLSEPGFLVVTKWGPEANDESLVVPKRN